MRSIINSLENLAGLSVYPIASLLIFFLFFSGVGFWIITASKQKMEKMRNLPFDDSSID
jgi:hypothetical protein